MSIVVFILSLTSILVLFVSFGFAVFWMMKKMLRGFMTLLLWMFDSDHSNVRRITPSFRTHEGR